MGPQVQSLGIVWVSPHLSKSGSCVHRDNVSICLPCVLSPWRFPTSELRVLPWLTCGPFSSLPLVTFTWGQTPLGGFLLCVLLSENLWWCYINIIAYHMLIRRVTAVWFPLDRAQVTYWIVILYWSRVDFWCFVLGIPELDSVIHRHLFFFCFSFFSYRLLQFAQESSLFYSVGPFSLSTWYILVCIFSSQTLNLSLPSNFLTIIRIWFSQAVSALYISSVVWIYRFHLYVVP